MITVIYYETHYNRCSILLRFALLLDYAASRLSIRRFIPQLPQCPGIDRTSASSAPQLSCLERAWRRSFSRFTLHWTRNCRRPADRKRQSITTGLRRRLDYVVEAVPFPLPVWLRPAVLTISYNANQMMAIFSSIHNIICCAETKRTVVTADRHFVYFCSYKRNRK